MPKHDAPEHDDTDICKHCQQTIKYHDDGEHTPHWFHPWSDANRCFSPDQRRLSTAAQPAGA